MTTNYINLLNLAHNKWQIKSKFADVYSIIYTSWNRIARVSIGGTMKEYKVTYAESERQQYIFLIDGDKISSISVIKRGETTKYSLNPKEGEEQLTAKFFGSVMEKMVQNKFSAFDIITLLVKEPQEYVDAYLEAFKRDMYERRKWEERHLSK